MREIKFRGKRLDNGEWVDGYGIVFADDFCIIDQSNELYVEEEYKFRGDTHFFRLSGVMCDPNSVGQFTGLLDKNGKEIYEGDVYRFEHPDSVNEVSFSIGGGFAGWDFSPAFSDAHKLTNIEVIGNIHDNPELLNP